MNREIYTTLSQERWVWRAYLNMSVPYLKTEVAKYICSLLRIFKIAHHTQQSRDLMMEYK